MTRRKLTDEYQVVMEKGQEAHWEVSLIGIVNTVPFRDMNQFVSCSHLFGLFGPLLSSLYNYMTVILLSTNGWIRL